jgi:hypothetical protein
VNERYLVALVLLTRLHDADLYGTVWDSHPELVSFCTGLLLPSPSSSPTPTPVQVQVQVSRGGAGGRENDTGDGASASESLELYARLIAQLVGRMRPPPTPPPPTPPSRRLSKPPIKIIQELSQALLTVLDARREQNAVLGAVDVDILSSWNVWFGILGNDDSVSSITLLLDGVLTTLWKRYFGLTRLKGTKVEAATANANATASTASESQMQSAQVTMNRTLTKLLDDGVDYSGVDYDPSREEQDLWKSWEVESTAIFLQQGMWVGKTQIPTFWLPALQFWLQSELSSKRPGSQNNKNTETFLPQIALATRRSWARILLVCARNMALLPSFQTKLKQDATLDKDVARFILTCVASVQGSDSHSDSLRSTAWSTTATLLQSCGWEWLLVGAVSTTPSSSSSSSGQDVKKADFGNASSLCTLIRLAVGEWKIQLGLLVDESCTLVSEERLLLVEACAQVLVESVHFVVQMANRMDEAANDDEADEADDNNNNASLPLSADALIHLRQSLDEALHVAVQYLGLAEKRVLSVDGPVVRVLGTLLREFDAFEQKKSTEDEEGNEILQALRVALDIHDVECQEELLPCLVVVLASSEEDEAKLTLLEEYELLDEPLVGFLESYWKQTTNLSSIEYAYQVVAKWSSMAHISDTSGLLECIIGWIDRNGNAPESSPRSNELTSALSTAIGCYVTLHGEKEPGEPDATILQRAIQSLR